MPFIHILNFTSSCDFSTSMNTRFFGIDYSVQLIILTLLKKPTACTYKAYTYTYDFPHIMSFVCLLCMLK